MIEDIKTLLEETSEIRLILAELKDYEAGEGADYSGIVTEFKWNKLMLRNRLNQLKREAKNG